MTRRFLREQPHNWEGLYREGVALARLERPGEAETSFRALLELREDDDQPGHGHAPGLGQKPTQGQTVDCPLEDRIDIKLRTVIREEVGLNVPAAGEQKFWTPADVGQGRMGALAWLLALAQRDAGEEAFFQERRAARDPSHKDLRGWWDWWYLQLIHHDMNDVYETARVLYEGQDLRAQWALLSCLENRKGYKLQPGNHGQPAVQKPLPKAEVDAVLESYRLLRQQRPVWVNKFIFPNVIAELRGAGRLAEADEVYRQATEDLRDLAWTFDLLEMAARRGDVDETFKLFEQVARIQGVRQKPMEGRNFPPLVEASVAFAHLMQVRSDQKALPDVLRVLDGYLSFRRQRAQVEKVIPWSGNAVPLVGMARMMLGNNPALLQVTFPLERNRYFDMGSVRVLRKALDLYTKADLLSDLMAHCQKQAEEAKQPYDQTYAQLTLAYLLWWQEDFEPALRHLNRACELAPDDAELQLQLAEGYEQLGRLPEALARLETVPTLDHVILQRRETAVLRVAARAGNQARARQAAERLFGLRLDPEKLAGLAGQMEHLQMHDLAEAVLNRAQRQAGGRPPALAALLAQYQAQGKKDTALQVANQIVRATMPQSAGQQDRADAAARMQALQLLGRSGKLPELIARVEQQLQSAPRSTYLLQMLIEYCEASGDKAQIRSAYERLAQRNPDDPQARFQIGWKLAGSGEQAAALPHLTAALRRQPALYSSYSYLILPVFQQLNKLDELADVLEAGNLRAVNSYAVGSLSNLLLGQEPTRPRGLKLLAKAWQVFPEQRPTLLQQLTNDKVWQLPEVFAYSRQVVLPAGKEELTDPWIGLQGTAPRLLKAATPAQLATLTADVEQALQDRPDWKGGKALLALLYVRRNQPERGRPLLAALLDDAGFPLPLTARMLLGANLAQAPALQDLALRLYEGGVNESLENQDSWLTGSPIPPVLSSYQKAGRTADARALALRAAAVYLGRDIDPNISTSSIQNQGRSVLTLAQNLQQIGYPIDALQLYLSLAGNSSLDPYEKDRVNTGIAQCMQSFRPESRAATLRTALDPRERAADAPPLDLLVVSHPSPVDQVRLRSLLGEALQTAGKEPALLAEAQNRLTDLRRQHPNDIPLHVAEVLLTLPLNRPDSSREVVERLLHLVEGTPLEGLPEGVRANARQRAEARPQVALWLAARECFQDHELRSAADQLASRALEAARRQPEPGLAQAVLREAGLLALQRGERPAAEAYWSELLERALALGVEGRAARKTPPAGTSVPALTQSQLKAAFEVAALTAQHKLGTLAVRAVKSAVRGGPPVAPVGGDLPGQPRTFSMEMELTVELWMFLVDRLWRDARVEPELAYEALAEAVLPTGRPAEVFLYPRPLSQYGDVPGRLQSVGALLAARAVEAGREEDLLGRLARRQEQPLAALSARVLQVLLARAANKPAPADALGWLAQRLEKESLPANVELACHAALAALDDAATAPAAITILERAAGRGDPGVLALRALARNRFKNGDKDGGRQYVLRLLKTPPPQEPRPDLVFYRPQTAVTASPVVVASELSRAGLWDDVWNIVGQIADQPPSLRGESLPWGLWEELTRQAALLAAGPRYAHWKSWSMPTATRQSVRAFHAFAYEQSYRTDSGGEPLSSLGLLIEAARAAGQLDELIAELGKLTESRVENAAAALLLAQIARGPSATLEKALEDFQADLTRRNPKRVEASPNYSPTQQTFPWTDYLVARACLDDAKLRPRGEAMARVLLNNPTARGMVSRDLQENPAALDLLIQIQEAELEAALNPTATSFSSALFEGRFSLYRRANRPADGRAAALRYVKMLQAASSERGQAFLARNRQRYLVALGQGLVELGYPADAVPIYFAAFNQPTAGAEDQLRPHYEETARTGLIQALNGLKPEQRADALKVLLPATVPADLPAGASALDLMLFLQGTAEQATLTSPIDTLIRRCADDRDLIAEAQKRLAALAREKPQDLAVAVGVALAALAREEDAEAAAAAIDRLLELTATALDPLPAGTLPTYAHETAARPRLTLWLAARACNRSPALRARAETLASRAWEAARRQRDSRSLFALLREQGLQALERGDSGAAETVWSELLTAPEVPPAVGLSLAQLAADKKASSLSLKALKQALAAPQAPVADEDNVSAYSPLYSSPTQRYLRGSSRISPTKEGDVPTRLAALAGLWEKHQAPAAEVYEALAEVVLPAARPLEVFPYPSFPEGVFGGSGGELLVRWAIRAGRGDDLRERLAARGKHPLATVPVHLLEAQLAVALNDAPRTTDGLAWFAERLHHDQQSHTVLSACRAGLAALALAPAKADARRLVEQAVGCLGRDSDFQLSGQVQLALARHLLQAGPKDAGRELIRTCLRPEAIRTDNLDYLLYGPGFYDFPRYQATERRLVEPAEAVEVLVQAGLSEDAWDVLGQWADDQGKGSVSYPASPPPSWIALVRRLAELPAAQRYAGLEAWSLPTADHAGVRIVAVLAASEEPPAVFQAWKAPSDGPVLNTARLLVDSAREAAKLEELAARLRPLVDRKAPNAAELLALVQLTRGPAADGPAVETLLEQLNRPAGYPTWPQARQPISWPTLLVVRACLGEPRLREAGQRVARRLLEQASSSDPGTALLRRELAVHEGRLPPAIWRPSTSTALGTLDSGELHLEAETNGSRFQLAYPLAGRFELSVEAAFGTDQSGVLGYAGSSSEVDRLSNINREYTYDPFGDLVPVRSSVKKGWQRLTVQVEPGLTRFLQDGKVVHEDKEPDPASPFLTLAGSWQSRAAFRNAQLTGDPDIPREVSLLRGDRLDSWTGAYYSNRVRSRSRAGARFAALKPQSVVEPDDWVARDGILDGRRLEKATAATPSVLAYQRPLQAGETVSYDFFYQPGEVMVHPALGRLAFLLEPVGVRLHWLGNFPFDEALGIKADNAVDEPACRRGPAELPLKANAWNQADLSVEAGRVRIQLNGVLVYERPLEATADHAFGLFHYQDRTAARVRNVVLTGDWPQKLTEAQRRNLLAPVEP
jgi:hypothetical protein